MDELRKTYHHELEQARSELARLAALVAELIPRATAVLLEGDLEGFGTDGRHDEGTITRDVALVFADHDASNRCRSRHNQNPRRRR